MVAIHIDGKKLYKCHKHEGLAMPGDMLIIGSDVVHSASSITNNGWKYSSVYLSNKQISDATGLSEFVVNKR